MTKERGPKELAQQAMREARYAKSQATVQQLREKVAAVKLKPRKKKGKRK